MENKPFEAKSSVRRDDKRLVLSRSTLISSILDLSKPGLTSLVVFTTITGYAAAGGLNESFFAIVPLILGTALSAAGANAMNQAIEYPLDALMSRTRLRPVALGELTKNHALFIGAALLTIGVATLALTINILTAFLAFLTATTYISIYTPLKRITPLSAMAGAITGAIPPMMGVTAVTGQLTYLAWTLFAVLFVWQIPHFVSLAYRHGEDYERAGIKTLVQSDPSGALPALVAFIHALALIPLSLAVALALPSLTAYGFIAVLLGILHLIPAGVFLRERNIRNAKVLFLAGVSYLALLSTVLIVVSL